MSPAAPDREALIASLDALDVDALRRSERIKWRLHGDDVWPAWVAEMDFPVAEPIRRALAACVDRSDLGYHRVPLSRRLRAALVERMAERFDWKIEPRAVAPLVNVVQGLDAAVLQFSRPGEGVCVLTPIYPPFLAAVTGSGRRLDACPLVREAGRDRLDEDALRRALRPDTRVLLLCHPHNPTGRVFGEDELAAIAALAVEHDLIVVSDEIHADLAYPGHRHRPLATQGPEIAARTLTLTSATKAFNLAGVPCAFAILGGDRVREGWRALPPHLLGHCGLLDDAATYTAWTEGGPWLDAVLAVLERNRDRVLARFARDLPDCPIHRPEATYLAWIDCRALGVADPCGFFLERARVALSDGREFGPPGEGFVRLNFATSAAILDTLLDRLVDAARAHAG